MPRDVTLEIKLETIRGKVYNNNIINLYHVTHEEVNKVKLTEGLIIIAKDLGLEDKLYKYYQYK